MDQYLFNIEENLRQQSDLLPRVQSHLGHDSHHARRMQKRIELIQGEINDIRRKKNLEAAEEKKVAEIKVAAVEELRGATKIETKETHESYYI